MPAPVSGEPTAPRRPPDEPRGLQTLTPRGPDPTLHCSLPVPQALPPRPLVLHGEEIISSHLLTDCLDVPSGERRQRLRLLLVPLG
jgi:hypothetical protein